MFLREAVSGRAILCTGSDVIGERLIGGMADAISVAG